MKIATFAFLISLAAGAAGAQQLDVDFAIVEDGQAAGCAGGVVSGLSATGDGFLAVRGGPGTGYPKIDELVNGDMVRVCAESGAWVGVTYGAPRRKGWVHGKWLAEGAG